MYTWLIYFWKPIYTVPEHLFVLIAEKFVPVLTMYLVKTVWNQYVIWRLSCVGYLLQVTELYPRVTIHLRNPKRLCRVSWFLKCVITSSSLQHYVKKNHCCSSARLVLNHANIFYIQNVIVFDKKAHNAMKN